MRDALSIVLGACLGTAVAWFSRALPVAAAVQSGVAAAVSMLAVTAVLSVFAIRMSRPQPGETGGIYMGIGPESAFAFVLTGLLGAGAHEALGYLDRAAPAVVANRTLLLGAFAGLLGAVQVVWALHLLARMDGHPGSV